MENMENIKKSYSKCFLCIKEGSAAEKEVVSFWKVGICLCERHLQEIVINRLKSDGIIKD